MKKLQRIMVALVISSVMSVFSGCGPGMIPGTSIEATDGNLEVYDVVEKYRKGMEERDIDQIMGLVSRQYFDNAGTTHTDKDDYGYEVLREKRLPLLKENIKKIKMNFRLTRIEHSDSRARADFEVKARFLYTEGGNDGWQSMNDFNRIELVREGNS